jgi:hypothetical protein
VSELEGHGLDAGERIRLQRGSQTRLLERVQPGYYRDSPRPGQPLFLDPGLLLLSGPGGKQVGSFTANVTIPKEFVWIDREQTKMIDRARGVTVHWIPGSPDELMFLMARNVDQITTAMGVCVCAMKASAGQFTVPPAILTNIPASQDVAGVPYDQLVLGAITVKPNLNAGGLTRGFLITLFSTARFVQYR